ncbi:hypothetical protein AB4383_03955 [Vibrio breoganii]
MKKILWFAVPLVHSLMGCSSNLSPEERQTYRDNIDQESVEIIDKLSVEYIEIPGQLEQAYGYATISMSSVKAPFFGAGTGLGGIYSRTGENVTYVDVDRYDFGAGIGLESYDALVILDSEQDVERFKLGYWRLDATAEYSIGDTNSYRSATLAGDGSDKQVYLLNNSGGSVMGGARLISTSVNDDLTESGLGDTNLPNRKIEASYTEAQPRRKQWDRAFPFYAQRVVDKGFSLPNPYGISLIYSNTSQYMDLTNLDVGINGSKKYPIDFVSFDDNQSHAITPQIKLDVWVFPFMNVFATFGKLSGTADIGIQFSGDDLIEQLGTDCSRPILNPPACKLQGKDVGGFVEADLDGYNYTVGTILATGWNDYFFTLPISFSYADMSKNDAEGFIVNASPRIGKVFPLHGASSIAVYTGAAYLDSRLTLVGTYTFEGVDIDYTVDQENTDKWSGLLGASYNFNRDWSLMMEYAWKSDRKQQFISGLNFRY